MTGNTRITRRAALSGLSLGVAALAGTHVGWPGQRRALLAQTDVPDRARFPALDLKIPSPPPGTRPEVDLKADFGAVGDGSADDGPALQAAAAAVNSGHLPSGVIINIPRGTYRVAGNGSIILKGACVLRGAGPGVTVIRPEFDAQRSVMLRAVGQGMYVRHSTGPYNGVQGRNDYPPGPYAEVLGTPRRGGRTLEVSAPEVFAAGSQAILLCDDYGEEIAYSPTNRRLRHYLLKQYVGVRAIEGAVIQLDQSLRHDFAGPAPRLYAWKPLAGFGLESLSIEDGGSVADTEAFTTFRAVDLDGVIDGWVWNVQFLRNTSIPLSIRRSRRVVVSECLFEGARHVGGGGNGYLPEVYYSDDCLMEYCTSIGGRHALICNWSCWGNAFRYNRPVGTPNTETHGEYSVENLYLRNDARGSRMEIGGGGDRVHAHDGPLNELRENSMQIARVLKPADRDSRLVGNWWVEPPLNLGSGTTLEGNTLVPADWGGYPYAAFCGHDHRQTAESAAPVAVGGEGRRE